MYTETSHWREALEVVLPLYCRYQDTCMILKHLHIMSKLKSRELWKN